MDRTLQAGDIFVTRKHTLPCLVVSTAKTGGGTGHGPHDIYPNGHNVRYVQLNKRQSTLLRTGKPTTIKGFDPKEASSFYQTGAFNGMILPEEVTLLGHVNIDMTMTIKAG